MVPDTFSLPKKEGVMAMEELDAEASWWTNVRGEALTESLIEEGERGQVLIAAEFFQRLLEECLRTRFRREGASKKLVNALLRAADEGWSPLGDFSVRIRVCRAFGLIGEDSYEALESLRDLRNVFAHSDFKVQINDIPLDVETADRRLKKSARALRSLKAYLENNDHRWKSGGPLVAWESILKKGMQVTLDNPLSHHQVFLGALICLWISLSFDLAAIDGKTATTFIV
jgi:DNA-binding MltR family transcriptional regulator